MEELSNIQNNILIGTLLGDGSLIKYGKSKNARLAVDRSVNDIKYLQLQHRIFKKLCSNNIIYREKYNIKYNKVYKFCKFDTKSLSIITKYYNEWYPYGKKIIPKTLKLNPLIIAIWFCDDGHVKIRGKNKNRLYLRFCSEGFSKEENLFLAKLLSEFCGETVTITPIYKNSNKYRILATDKAARAIAIKIDKYIPKCMLKKAKWREPQVRLYDPTFKPAETNYKNRNKYTEKETIIRNIIKNNPYSMPLHLLDEINKEFIKFYIKPLSDKYCVRFFASLYKRNIINRKLIACQHYQRGRKSTFVYYID